jgi:hypothetical protein
MEITKKELEKLYKENSNSAVCKKLGISSPTLILYLKKCNIPLKGKGKKSLTIIQ